MSRRRHNDEQVEQLDTPSSVLALIQSEFGAPLLTVELVPKSMWDLNLRSLLKTSDWERLRRSTYESAAHRCTVCGGVGQQYDVACHEVWSFADGPNVQRLAGLTALCPACHDVKHAGRAIVQGRSLDVRMRLRDINRWSASEVSRYLHLELALWNLRNRREWDLDLTFLARFKVSPSPNQTRGTSARR